jgi:hypothetical protein
MSNSSDLLQAAIYAIKSDGDKDRGLSIARQVLEHYPNSPEAAKAQTIIDKLSPKSAGVMPDREEVYSAEQWSGAKAESELPEPKTKYGTARGVASFIEVLGWLVVIIGVFVGFQGGSSNAGVAGILIGAAVAFSGLMLIASAQVVRATVDTADNTQHMVALLKKMQ